MAMLPHGARFDFREPSNDLKSYKVEKIGEDYYATGKMDAIALLKEMSRSCEKCIYNWQIEPNRSMSNE